MKQLYIKYLFLFFYINLPTFIDEEPKEKNIFNSLSYKKLKNQRKVLGCDECSARNICSQCFEKMIYTNDVLKFNCDKIRQFNRYYIASIDNININELSKLKTRN